MPPSLGAGIEESYTPIWAIQRPPQGGLWSDQGIGKSFLGQTRVDIRNMRHLLAVREHGSFAKAAQVLQISQPSLSASISRLEDRLKVKLFERSAAGSFITPVGEFVAERASRVIAEVDRANGLADEGFQGGPEAIDPLLDVDRLQPLDREVAGDRAGERLEVVAVPVVGPRGAVLLAPVEERVEDREHGVAGRQSRLISAARHQVVIAAERLVAVGAEVDLAAVDLDVPEPTRGAEERLEIVRRVRSLPGHGWAGRSASGPRMAVHGARLL